MHAETDGIDSSETDGIELSKPKLLDQNNLSKAKITDGIKNGSSFVEQWTPCLLWVLL